MEMTVASQVEIWKGISQLSYKQIAHQMQIELDDKKFTTTKFIDRFRRDPPKTHASPAQARALIAVLRKSGVTITGEEEKAFFKLIVSSISDLNKGESWFRESESGKTWNYLLSLSPEAAPIPGQAAFSDEFNKFTRSLSPAVLNVYGMMGVGKTRLLKTLSEQANFNGWIVAWVEGSNEMSQHALFDAVNSALAKSLPNVGRVVKGQEVQRGDVISLITQITASRQPIILFIDQYECLEMIDAWIRDDLINLLKDHIYIVIIGQNKLFNVNQAWDNIVKQNYLEITCFERAAFDEVIKDWGVPNSTWLYALTGGYYLLMTSASHAAKDYGWESENEIQRQAGESFLQRVSNDQRLKEIEPFIRAAAALDGFDAQLIMNVMGVEQRKANVFYRLLIRQAFCERLDQVNRWRLKPFIQSCLRALYEPEEIADFRARHPTYVSTADPFVPPAI